MNRSINLLAGILVVLAAVAGSSCTNAEARAQRDVHVLVGVDVSGSARNVAGAYGQGLRRLAMRLDSRHDRITIVRFGTTAEEIYNGPAPSSSERFTEFYNEAFAKGAVSKGTHPGKLFASFLDTLSRLPGDSHVSIVVFTDGGNDDLSRQSQSAYEAAAKQLAGDGRVDKLVFAGVRPGQREAIYKLFGAMEDRLVIQGEDKLQVDF